MADPAAYVVSMPPVRIDSLGHPLGGLASQLVMLTSTLVPLVTERMDSREKQSEIGER